MLRIFIFNLSGRLTLVVISLVTIPIYVRYLGVADYGIIGIYNSLATLAAIFDVAFSNTINRELARRSAVGANAEDVGAVFRTLEIFAWMVAAILAALLIGAAGLLVNGWIGPEKYAGRDIVGTVRLMGLLLLLQAPISFYSGCLYGMHRHGLINAINVCGTALSAALAIITVVFITPTIDAFFIAQLLGRIALVAGMAAASYTLIVRDVGWGKLRASVATFRKLWRFALGMNGLGVLTLLANQADMVILSRLLSATGLGYYAIARTGSQGLVALAIPAYQSAFPQLSKIVNSLDLKPLAPTFHRFCQYLALVLIPPALVTCVFPKEVLTLWTHNPVLAGNASLTLSLLVAGSLVYGLGCVINAVQIANGAVRFMIVVAALFLGLIVPALVFLVHFFAEYGAASAWLIVNILVTSFSATLTLRRYLAGELARWLAQDIVLPLAAAALPILIVRAGIAEPPGSTAAAVALFLAGTLAVAATAVVLPEVRAVMVRGLNHARTLLSS